MTPDFVRSQWCKVEVQMTMENDIGLQRRGLLPIMLHQCEEIPDCLKRVTYMEVDNEHFWARFISALQDIQHDAHGMPIALQHFTGNNSFRKIVLEKIVLDLSSSHVYRSSVCFCVSKLLLLSAYCYVSIRTKHYCWEVKISVLDVNANSI